MEGKIFLEHYGLAGAAEDKTVEIGRNGPAITYKASDLRSGAPVALTLVPISSVDPDERANFEEKARTAMLLDHAHIAKTVAFGTSDDQFVFVSELPQGETVDAWVGAHGAVPADAVLRIALQVVTALGAASFHGLTHPAIQPANLIIVRGKTAEGGWPFIKLTHFALAGLKSAPGQTDPDLNTSDFASPEQLLQGKVDFRSEIYSLGATMCFLLTGVLYSAHPRRPQTKRFLGPLRSLIARTLQDEPAERPQDPILFVEELRNCLVKVERRQAWERKLGMPFLAVVKKERRKLIVREFAREPRGLKTVLASVSPPAGDLPVMRHRGLFSRHGWAIAAGLLGLGIVSALLLPEDVVTAALHRKKSIKTIGVPVGVPDTSPLAMAQASPSGSPGTQIVAATNAPNAAQSPAEADVKPTAPVASLHALDEDNQAFTGSVAASENSAAASAPESAAPTPSTPARSNDQVATLATNTTAPEPAPPAEQAPNEEAQPNGPTEQPAATSPDQPTNREIVGNDSKIHPGDSIRKRDAASSPTTSKSQTKSSSVAEQNRARSSKPRAASSRARTRTLHGRVIAITPAGNVILLLPSGERAIVSPADIDQYTPDAPVHGPVRRAIIHRPPILVPPTPPNPPYQPFLPPDA